ncbi:TonB-dependent receptor [Daejeonella oryzae]|uniref:TonB-dependent receptor n=1 Tax=Daejeonella oryzae TaxID=1122943 RepID=UPI00041818AA|nr:TonB-dependent receptor [Daejeonella oryzae]
MAKTEAQTIQGILKNINDKPLSYVTVKINHKSQTKTDSIGHFELAAPNAGTYSLSAVLKDNSEIKLSTFTITSLASLDLGTLIADSTIHLKGVEIFGSERSFYGLSRLDEVQGTSIYAGKKNEVINLTLTDANLALNNTRQAFAKVPGLHIWEGDGTGTQMNIGARGLSPNRSWEFNTRQNGVDISADPFGYPESYYTPALEGVQKIEVIRGAASLQYGPQFGGAVNFVMKDASDKPLSIESKQTAGSYGVLNTYNSIGGTSGKWKYFGFINGRRGDSWRQNNSYNTLTGYVSAGYQVNEKLSLNLNITQYNNQIQQAGGISDLQFSVNPEVSFRARNWFSLAWNIPSITMDYKINSNSELTLKTFALFGNRNSIGNTGTPEQDFKDAGSSRAISKDSYSNFGTELRYRNNYTLFNTSHTLATGLRYFTGETIRQQGIGSPGNNADYDYFGDNAITRNLDLDTKNYAFFAENIFRPLKRLSVTPGFRVEYIKSKANGMVTPALNVDNLLDRTVVLGGLGLGYQLTLNTDLYANASQSFRPFLFGDLYPGNLIDETDPNLKDAKGFNLDLGYRGVLNDFLNFDVSGFLLKYNNRVGDTDRTKDINGIATSYKFKTNAGDSRSYGLESFLEINPLRALKIDSKAGYFTLYNSLAYVNASYTAGAFEGKKVENSPEWIVRSGLNYYLSRFNASFNHSYTAKAFSDPANTAIANRSGSAGQLPAYSVMDLSLGYKIKKHLNIKLVANNLTDAAYFTRRTAGNAPGVVPGEGRTFFLSLSSKF